MHETITIPSGSQPHFFKTIAQLNRKAAKLGRPAITANPVEASRRILKQSDIRQYKADGEFAGENSTERLVEVIDIEVHCEEIRLNGWGFAAAVEVVDSATRSVVLHTCKNITIPERYQAYTSVCEHCNTKRFRTKFFIVNNDSTGEFKQVGSSCLADFCGIGSEGIVAQFRFQSTLFEVIDLSAEDCCERGCGCGGHGSSTQPFRDGLKAAIALHRTVGFKSVSAVKHDEEFGTSDGRRANSYLLRKIGTPEWNDLVPVEFSTNYDAVTEADVDTLLEWLDTQDQSVQYFRNIQLYREIDLVSDRGLGLLAALPNCRESALARAIREERGSRSQFVGTVKARQEFTGTIERIFTFDSQWGTSYITILWTDDGNCLKCGKISGIDFLAGEEQGKRVTFKATVKDHADYKGTKQTVLTRAKVL